MTVGEGATGVENELKHAPPDDGTKISLARHTTDELEVRFVRGGRRARAIEPAGSATRKLHALAWAMRIRLARSSLATLTLGALGLAVLPHWL